MRRAFTATLALPNPRCAVAPELLRGKWEDAFGGFKAAWDGSWHSVGRHGCLTIPKDFLSLRQDGGTCISFSLPGPSDEGICPNALADYLIRVHNDFVARVDQVLLMRGMDVQRHSTRKNEISSRHMTPVHSLVFDTAVEFVPYVAKHCLHYGAAGSGESPRRKVGEAANARQGRHGLY